MAKRLTDAQITKVLPGNWEGGKTVDRYNQGYLYARKGGHEIKSAKINMNSNDQMRVALYGLAADILSKENESAS